MKMLFPRWTESFPKRDWMIVYPTINPSFCTWSTLTSLHEQQSQHMVNTAKDLPLSKPILDIKSLLSSPFTCFVTTVAGRYQWQFASDAWSCNVTSRFFHWVPRCPLCVCTLCLNGLTLDLGSAFCHPASATVAFGALASSATIIA